MDQDILLVLGRIDGKLDSLIKAVNHHVEEDKETFKVLDERLMQIETAHTFQRGQLSAVRWITHAISAGIAGIVGLVVSIWRS